jgi:uncharacterized protein
MKIQVGGLSEGVHEYHFVTTGAEIGLGSEFSGNVTVDVSLEKTGTQIFLESRIGTTGHFVCDRCVTDFTIAVTPSYRMYYVWDGANTDRFDRAEVQVISPGLNMIDITEDVRQVVLLAVPLKLLCKDECKGLCPHCGKNRNIEACNCSDDVKDSRWEALRTLQKNNLS